MKIVDANVLLYAVDEAAPRHAAARSWLDTALSGASTVGFAWSVVLAFLRLGTHPAVFPRPLALEDAIEIAADWLAQPAAVIVEPTTRHLALLRGLLDPLGAGGNLVADAHLGALALEHAAEVVSFDTDFARFPGVRWHPPDHTH